MNDDHLSRRLAEPVVAPRDPVFLGRITREDRRRRRRALTADLVWNGVLVACAGAVGGGAVAGLAGLIRLFLDSLR